MSKLLNVFSMPKFTYGQYFKFSLMVLAMIAGLHLILTVTLGHHFFSSYSQASYDLGLHLNGIWKLAFADDQYSYIRGANYLGDHLWLINYLILPIFKLFPSHLTLLILQSLSLAGSSLLIFLIAEKTTKH